MTINSKITDHDVIGLSEPAIELLHNMELAGFDRAQLHGFMVFLGFYGGMPRTEEEQRQVMPIMDKHFPQDRSRYIEDIVGDFYDGYELVLGEFIYKWGAQITFRDIRIDSLSEAIHVLDPQDYGLIKGGSKGEVLSTDKLSAFTQLYLPFLSALGDVSANAQLRDWTFIESYLCGAFQFGLIARADLNAARQLAIILTDTLPLTIGTYFKAFTQDNIDYTKGLLADQVPIAGLGVGPVEYGQQFWVFQSWLYFRDGKPIEHADEQLPVHWHEWVLANAKIFDETYPEGLLPLSKSNVVLRDLPQWGDEVADFQMVDDYIDRVWGYKGSDALSIIEGREYRALLTHVVFSSLAYSRESRH